MQEAALDLTQAAFDSSAGRYRGDNHLLVKFFTHPRLNTTRSAEEGRPIYVDTPYIQIMTPGNKDSIVIRPATEMDKARFAEHYRKYQAREDQDAVEGTLLEEWPAISRSQVEELKFLNIRTVEQLANLSDSNGQHIMGVNMLKQKAVKFLDEAKGGALQEAQEMIRQLSARLAALEAVEEPEEEEEDEDGDD
jgi:hypothetical protein